MKAESLFLERKGHRTQWNQLRDSPAISLGREAVVLARLDGAKLVLQRKVQNRNVFLFHNRK